MVFTEGPIYGPLATSGRAEKGSKMNFAMEPNRTHTLTFSLEGLPNTQQQLTSARTVVCSAAESVS